MTSWDQVNHCMYDRKMDTVTHMQPSSIHYTVNELELSKIRPLLPLLESLREIRIGWESGPILEPLNVFSFGDLLWTRNNEMLFILRQVEEEFPGFEYRVNIVTEQEAEDLLFLGDDIKVIYDLGFGSEIWAVGNQWNTNVQCETTMSHGTDISPRTMLGDNSLRQRSVLSEPPLDGNESMAISDDDDVPVDAQNQPQHRLIDNSGFVKFCKWASVGYFLFIIYLIFYYY